MTILYRAPELFYRVTMYSPAIDVWSVGCIFAGNCIDSIVEMVRGRSLFEAQGEIELLHDIHRKLGGPSPSDFFNVDVNECGMMLDTPPESELAEYVPRLDPVGVDLLSRMLVFQSSKRIRCSRALQHAYLAREE